MRMEDIDHGLHHIAALASVHGLSAEGTKKEAEWRLEQGMLTNKVDFQPFGEFHKESKRKIPIRSMGPRDDHVFF